MGVRFVQTVSIAATGIILSGCALMSPTEAYYPITPASGKSLQQFEAYPEAEEIESLTLKDAIATALSRNPAIAAANYDLAASLAQTDEAKGALYPYVSAEGGYSRYSDAQRLAPASSNGAPGTFSKSIYSSGIDVKMPVFAGGRYINETRSAELLGKASEYRLGRTRHEIAFDVANVFYDILAQEKLIASLLVSQETLESHVNRVKELIDARKAAQVDLLRTEVRLADIRQTIVAERSKIAIQKRLLLNLMGMSSPNLNFTLNGSLAGAEGNNEQPLTEAVEEAFASRQDYLAAQKELEAQAKVVDVARAGHSPSVNLLGSYGGRWAGDTTSSATGNDDFENAGVIGIGVGYPLFDGGRVSAKVKTERAKLASMQERLKDKENQIRLEVETAMLNLDSAIEREKMLEKSVEQARESLRIEQDKYQLGKGAIVDVLDAQAALLEAETKYYRAIADEHISRLQIRLVTGKEINEND